MLYRAAMLGGELRDELAGSTDGCQFWSKSALPEMVDLGHVGLRFAFRDS